MQRTGYFFLSGFLSVSVYLAICISFLIYVNAPKPKKFDSSKTTVLELELISTKAEEKKVAKKTVEKQPEIVKKSTSKSHKQKAVNAKSLFANVKTKAVKKTEKVVTTAKESIDPSRFKSKFQKQKKTDNTNVSKLLNDTKTTTNISKASFSGKGEKDKYFSQIQELLWQRWNPRLLEPGLKVKVLVTITKDGRFDYRIMKYSNDQRFDQLLKEFLESQKNESFPTHNIKSKVGIITNFKSEG